MISEYCSKCEIEVKIKQGFVKQKCPICGEPILPCSLCDNNEVDCKECLVVQK